MFICDVTKTPHHARNFVYSELLLILQTVTFPLGLTGETIIDLPIFQKVYFEMFSKLDHRQYESTVRGCSSNCVQRDDFPSNCSTLLRESRGCIKRTCCQDYDLCNSVTRTSALTELILIMFVCLVVNYWCD